MFAIWTVMRQTAKMATLWRPTKLVQESKAPTHHFVLVNAQLAPYQIASIADWATCEMAHESMSVPYLRVGRILPFYWTFNNVWNYGSKGEIWREINRNGCSYIRCAKMHCLSSQSAKASRCVAGTGCDRGMRCTEQSCIEQRHFFRIDSQSWSSVEIHQNQFVNNKLE